MKFKLNIQMGKKGDLRDSEPDIPLGAKLPERNYPVSGSSLKILCRCQRSDEQDQMASRGQDSNSNSTNYRFQPRYTEEHLRRHNMANLETEYFQAKDQRRASFKPHRLLGLTCPSFCGHSVPIF